MPSIFAITRWHCCSGSWNGRIVLYNSAYTLQNLNGFYLWFRLIVRFNLNMVSSLMVCNCKCLLCQLSDRKKARKKSNNFATKWKGRDHLPSHYNPIVGVKLRGKNHVYANSHFIALKREYYLPTLSNLRMYISPSSCVCALLHILLW